MSPVVEALGLLATIVGFSLGALNIQFAILFLLAAYGYGLVLTTFTMVLEGYRPADDTSLGIVGKFRLPAAECDLAPAWNGEILAR